MSKVLYLSNSAAFLPSFVPDCLNHLGFSVATYQALDSVTNLSEFDIIVSDRFPNKIPLSVVEEFEGRTLNLHASVLPSYRGSYPVLFCLINGEIPGWSIHRIARVIDAGEVVASSRVTLDLHFDTLRSVWLRCQLDMFNSLVNNFKYFSIHRNFPLGLVKATAATPSFFYREQLNVVRERLYSGWDTPVSAIFGIGLQPDSVV